MIVPRDSRRESYPPHDAAAIINEFDRRRSTSTKSVGTSPPKAPRDQRQHDEKSHSADSANNANAIQEWDNPIPFTSQALPTFPLENLPAWLGQYGHELAESTQTPPDMAGGMLLAAVSVAASKKIEVRLTPDWSEPLVVWTVTALPPAHRKSAIVRAVSGPLFDWEQRQSEAMRPAIDAARTKLEVLQQRRQKLVKDAGAVPATEAAKLIEELDELDREIAESQPPAEPRLLADDCTPEALATLARKNHGRIGILAAEGDVFDIVFGRYSKSGTANLGFVLKAHAGDSHRVDRGSRPTEFIDKPALPMGLCIQPEVLRLMQQQKGFRERGGLGRMLFSVPKSTLGHRRIDTSPVLPQTEATYIHEMGKLLEITVPLDSNQEMIPTILDFSPKALEVFNVYRAEVEGQLGELGCLGFITDWGGKLPGAVARIAGLLHVATHVGRDIPKSIGPEVVGNAIELGRYFTAHALAAFQLMGDDPSIAKAEYVLRWIRHKEWSEFTKRGLFEVVKGKHEFSKAEDLDEPLRLLESHNYIAAVKQQRTGPGRKPSPMFLVNPAVAQFAESAQLQLGLTDAGF